MEESRRLSDVDKTREEGGREDQREHQVRVERLVGGSVS